MGCLFALLGGLFPRLAVFILWIARPERVDAAFSSFLWPLLGIIFLPFATLIYLLLYTPGRGVPALGWVHQPPGPGPDRAAGGGRGRAAARHGDRHPSHPVTTRRSQP